MFLTKNLLAVRKTKYVTLDNHVLEDILAVFAVPPDLSVPIDVYFKKQEECQRQAEGSDDPIKGGDMVRMLQNHMGDSGTLTKKRVKFDKRAKALKTWLHGKEFYRDALEDLEKEPKCAGARVPGKQHRRSQGSHSHRRSGPPRDGNEDGRVVRRARHGC